ncbi:MAG: MBL fold metallo-hydrolase [Flavobacteriales bacterium]|nr:MBL fold metallo-hydrolase [Flavobacteriales bacterium]
MLKRIIKRVFAFLGIVISLITIVGVAFVNLSPQFGGHASDEQKEAYTATGHYEDGVFTNKEMIIMEMNCHSISAMIKETINPDPNVAPPDNIEVEKFDPKELLNIDVESSRVTWLGHSSFLLETAGKVILLDPVFGQYAAPHPLLGRARFNKEMPITIADIPHVNAVIISHGHYDHLDYESIIELRDKVEHFFVPLGVGNHLRRWEVAEDKISEMDWWQEVQLDQMSIVFTPSRHISGRGLTDQSATLWGSWVIQHQYLSLYFSGDGGYGEHFKEIGEQYGRFDIALMECGQYNDLWADVHMSPEQTVQASLDVKTDLMVPIHWGSFQLATHSWTDPVERATVEASNKNVPIATPNIGESITSPGHLNLSFDPWWEEEKRKN